MSYRKLEIWNKTKEMVLKIHDLTMNDLPKYEMYETGSQIRRSIKSVLSNITEGYGRRTHKSDFIHFLIMAQASLDETINHLEVLFETGSLKSEEKYNEINSHLHELGKMLNVFIRAVKEHHRT